MGLTTWWRGTKAPATDTITVLLDELHATREQQTALMLAMLEQMKAESETRKAWFDLFKPQQQSSSSYTERSQKRAEATAHTMDEWEEMTPALAATLTRTPD
jgi:hypothetical protein